MNDFDWWMQDQMQWSCYAEADEKLFKKLEKFRVWQYGNQILEGNDKKKKKFEI